LLGLSPRLKSSQSFTLSKSIPANKEPLMVAQAAVKEENKLAVLSERSGQFLAGFS
jgi:hypothetical protein